MLPILCVQEVPEVYTSCKSDTKSDGQCSVFQFNRIKVLDDMTKGLVMYNIKLNRTLVGSLPTLLLLLLSAPLLSIVL